MGRGGKPGSAGEQLEELKLYLESDGAFGESPDWYPLMHAARWMHVAPWDLAGIPDTAGLPYWPQWALWTEAGENHAVAAKQRAAAAQARIMQQVRR